MKKITILILILTLATLLACGSASEDRSFGGSEDNSSTNTDSNSTNATVQTSNAQTSTEQTNTTPASSPNPNNTATAAPSQSPSVNVSSTRISRFIWKPKAERDEKLVILVDAIRVRVEVTGDVSERLKDTGPSNGYGTTARSVHTGCTFGKNAFVEFFDSQNRPIRTKNGGFKLNIPDGCSRYEF